MVIDVRPVQSAKASVFMVFTELGMVKDVMSLQPENILNIDNQIVIR